MMKYKNNHRILFLKLSLVINMKPPERFLFILPIWKHNGTGKLWLSIGKKTVKKM